MKITLTTIGFLLTLAPAWNAYGQESVLGFPAGARNASLVNANIAETGELSVMYENPAPLAFLENRSVFLNHSQGIGSHGMQENIAFPVILRSPLVVAVGLDAYHQGYLGGSLPDSSRIFEYGYDVDVAGEMTPTLSVGASAAIRHGATGTGVQSWGSFFSFGADYAPTPDISYALVFGGIGRDVPFFPSDTLLEDQNGVIRRTLEVGATMTYPSSVSLRPPILILSFSNEKIFGIKGLYYKGGIEVRPMDFLELRFGYMAGPGLYQARYGVGILAKMLEFQYAICPGHGTKMLLQQFSASMEF